MALSDDLSDGEAQEEVSTLRDQLRTMVAMEAAAPDSRDATALPLSGWFRSATSMGESPPRRDMSAARF
jgi:hypothetical protein